MENLDYFFDSNEEIKNEQKTEDEWIVRKINSKRNGNIVFFHQPTHTYIHNKVDFENKMIETYTDESKESIINNENFYKYLKNAIKNIENESIPMKNGKFISFIHASEYFKNSKPKVIIYNFMSYIILFYSKEF